MSERIVRRDLESGQSEMIALEEAISELSTSPYGLFSEIAPRLRGGECLLLPNGRSYSAAAALELDGALPLAARLVN